MQAVIFSQELPTIDQMISVNEAAAILHLSPRMVRLHCEQGRLKSSKIGPFYAVSLRDVRAFAKEVRKPGPKPKQKISKI